MFIWKAKHEHEVSLLKEEIERLQKRLSSMDSRPVYYEVAKDFEPDYAWPAIRDYVISELEPSLTREALMALKQIMKGIEKDAAPYSPMQARVAYDASARVFEYQFRFNARTVSVKMLT